MNRHSKIILIVLSLFIGITVLRETGVVSWNYYRYTINSNSSIQSTNNSDAIDTSCSDLTGGKIPIVLEYEKKIIREKPSTDQELWIILSNTNSGAGWLPLYKNIDFSANASYSGPIILKDKHSGRCKNNNLSGSISITGSIKVTGFCSWRQVKQLIANDLIEIVKEKGHVQLKNL